MAYLRIYAGNKLRRELELSKSRITIGRAEYNDIVLKAPGISGLHATIGREGTSYVLVDNESTNGVYVNGERVERRSLEYWDEIQIYNFVLRFMALPKLPGEQDGELAAATDGPRQEQTQEVDVSSLRDLLTLRRQQNTAYFESNADHANRKHVLDKVNFTIGKDRQCDIRIGGWFAPRVAATIQRRAGGYYVIPSRRGRVFLNGKAIARTQKLEDAFEMRIRDLQLKYFCRPMDPTS